ncbi:MAG: hypothetical protein ACP5H8_03060 [Candidatus Micrarchaeia archaeon]
MTENKLKKQKPSLGSYAFAAGLLQNIYNRKLPPEKIMKLKQKLNSDEFKERLSKLSPEIQREILALVPHAEKHGSLDCLVSFVYGMKEVKTEDPHLLASLLADMKEHILCWDDRNALIAAIDAKGAIFKRMYGFEKEVDELIEKAKSLDDTALSCVYDTLSGAIINREGLSREEVGERIKEAILVLSSW